MSLKLAAEAQYDIDWTGIGQDYLVRPLLWSYVHVQETFLRTTLDTPGIFFRLSSSSLRVTTS